MCFRTLLGGSSIIIAIANIMIRIITFTNAVTTSYIIPFYTTYITYAHIYICVLGAAERPNTTYVNKPSSLSLFGILDKVYTFVH